jgi:hypothetical protein
MDSDANNGINSLDKGQIHLLLSKVFYIEQNLAVVTTNRRQFDLAEGHCQRCLAFSRRVVLLGNDKITFVFQALRVYCQLRERQGDYSGAVTVAEEAYNLVVEAYGCVHPQVQEAAGVLINILIMKGDYYDAERYAEVTYSNLKDRKNGMNQESEEVAMGAQNLANVILRQKGDLKKQRSSQERPSLRIRTLIHDSHHFDVGNSCDLLGRILLSQMNIGDETRELFERSLAILVRYEGSDGGINTATASCNIALYYYELAEMQPTLDSKRTNLLQAKSGIEKALRIHVKIFGATNPKTVSTAERLAEINSKILLIS